MLSLQTGNLWCLTYRFVVCLATCNRSDYPIEVIVHEAYLNWPFKVLCNPYNPAGDLPWGFAEDFPLDYEVKVRHKCLWDKHFIHNVNN